MPVINMKRRRVKGWLFRACLDGLLKNLFYKGLNGVDLLEIDFYLSVQTLRLRLIFRLKIKQC